MNEVLYEVFTRSFPKMHVGFDDFNDRLDLNDSTVFKKFDESGTNLIGFSVVRENCICLLCVLPEYRRQGIGSYLLSQSEHFISSNGYNEVLLGYKGERTSLFKGVPLTEGNYDFFHSKGYDNDFSFYDYEIKLSEEDKQDNSKYTATDFTSKNSLRMLLLQFLEERDKNLYEKYVFDKDVRFLVARDDKTIKGVCAYKVNKDSILEIHDLVAYPNFNMDCKKFLLGEMANVSKNTGCDKVIVCNLNNPSFYQKTYKPVEVNNYWRGSKSC